MRIVNRGWGASVVLLASACLNPHTAEAPKSTSAPSAPATSPRRSSGPDAAYTWKNVEVLGGGFVTGIIFSETEPGLVYARTDIGGAYRLDPQSNVWLPITDHISREASNNLGIESLALDPVDPNKVYLATGTYIKEWAPAGAMLRSNDRGKSWHVTEMPIKMGGNEHARSCGERLAVDPNQPERLLFGSRANGLWQSTDGAASWQPIEFPVEPGGPDAIGITFVLFDAKSGQPGQATKVVYAGVGRTDGPSLYASHDGGKTFAAVVGQPPGVLACHAELDADGTLYVAYRNHPGPNDVTRGAIYKLDPKRSRFTDISPLRPTDDDQFGYGGLSVDRKRPGTLVASTLDRWTHKDEIFHTRDGGKTWSPRGSNAKWDPAGAQYLYFGRKELHTPHWMGDIAIDPFDPDRAMFVTGAGIWATNNLSRANEQQPPSWRFFNQGLEETAILALASPPKGPPLLSGMGDICGFRHDDLDQAPPGGFYMNPQCNTTTGLDYAESNPAFVVRAGRVWNEEPHGAFSNDGGKSWRPFETEPANAKTGGVVAVTADGASIVWAPKGVVPAVSKDGGAAWTAAKGLPAGIQLPDWANFDLQPAADRVNPSLVYVYDAHNGSIYVSTDAGARFSRTFQGLPGLPDYQLLVASIEATPGFEGHVWVTTGKDVYRSTDAGKHFEPLGSVEESYGIGLGKAAPGKPYPTLYLSGKVNGTSGIFRSEDEGQRWVRINDDRHQFGGANVIEGDPRIYGRVYLGTHGRGIIYGTPR